MKRGRDVVTVLSAISVLVGSSSRSAAQRSTTLTVFAAASLTEPFTSLGKSFEAAHPGTTVRFNFTGSQQLVLQIQQGAKADVFASADERWMQTAKDSGLVEGEPALFAHNELVVIVPVANPAGIQRLAGPVPLRCKAGDRCRGSSGGTLHPGDARQALISAWIRIQIRPAGAGERCELRGEREGGGREGAARRGGRRSGLPLRRDRGRRFTGERSRFPMRPTSSRPIRSPSFAAAPSPELAKAFVELVRSAQGQESLKKSGFRPVQPRGAQPSP